MLSWSISRTEAAPTATATAFERMSGASRSRCCADRVFESRTPGIRWPEGLTMTAAATTAPQVGATPTSSTPTIRSAPSRQRRRSTFSVGIWTAMGGKGSAGLFPGARGRGGASAARGGGGGRAARAGRRRRLRAGASLPQRGGLADPLAQEVQLGAPDLAVANDVDLVDPGAVDLERPLDADARRDLPDGDGSGDPAAAEPHDGALEDLDALL